jgi:hypothetical protein
MVASDGIEVVWCLCTGLRVIFNWQAGCGTMMTAIVVLRLPLYTLSNAAGVGSVVWETRLHCSWQ